MPVITARFNFIFSGSLLTLAAGVDVGFWESARACSTNFSSSSKALRKTFISSGLRINLSIPRRMACSGVSSSA
jgi:hypothetical protein